MTPVFLRNDTSESLASRIAFPGFRQNRRLRLRFIQSGSPPANVLVGGESDRETAGVERGKGDLGVTVQYLQSRQFRQADSTADRFAVGYTWNVVMA
jgi:hypothetical protein